MKPTNFSLCRDGKAKMLNNFEPAGKQLGGEPHWSYLTTTVPPALSSAYPVCA